MWEHGGKSSEGQTDNTLLAALSQPPDIFTTESQMQWVKEHDELMGERSKEQHCRRECITFTGKQQTVPAEWLDNNPIFYNCKVKVYKGAQKKQCLLEEEAEELNMEGESCLRNFMCLLFPLNA